MTGTIYIASKTKHAERWRKLRAAGLPIISTWIDEAGVGETSDFHDLWRRCVEESSECDILVIYREPEDDLKGAWVELGSALAHDVEVFAFGIKEFSVSNHRNISHFEDFETLLAAVSKRIHTSGFGTVADRRI